MSDRHTPDPNLKLRRNWLRDVWQREEDDTTTVFAVLIAGVAMLFVAGIISAFMFARNDAFRNDAMEQRAERVAPSATAGATTTSGGTASRPAPPIARSEPETTGSRPQHDPREDEQIERER
jgi:hypothetical protein